MRTGCAPGFIHRTPLSRTTGARGHDAGSHVPSLRLLAAVLLAAAVVQACGTGGDGRTGAAGILALIPADAQNVLVYDLEQIRADGAPDDAEDVSGYGIEELGVVADEIATLALAAGDDWRLLVVEGDLDFAHVTEQLEDGDYDYDPYREFDLWEGSGWRYESVALLEDRGRMVVGGAEAVRRVLRMLDGGPGSLLDDADSDLGRTLKRAGDGWVSSAQEQCVDYEVRGCRAVGVSLRRGDDAYQVEMTVAILFRNERTAESELDELERQIEEDSSLEFDIDDVQLDGDFVIVTASADEDDLFEDQDDLSGRESPLPATPRGPAIGDTPAARDDHGDSAGEATFVPLGQAAAGALGHARDVDYFAFAAERGQTYRIDVDLGTLDDSVAILYGPDGRELESDDDGGESYGSRITWTAAESGTHYVAVEGWAIDTGSYALTVTAMGDAPATGARATTTPDPGAPAARDDHGDSAGGATFAAVGQAVAGALGHARDVDYFAFAAERGQTYRIDVDLGTLDDSVAALFGPDGRELEFDDDGGESFGSRITWTAAESGTHYVAVAGWAIDTGSYTLTVTATGDAPAAGAPDPGAPAATDDRGASTEGAVARAADAGTPPEAPVTVRADFDAATPPGYMAVTLRTSGGAWGVPSRYSTDSNAGAVAYVLLGSVKGCAFADAEAARGSRVYIRTRDLGRLANYTSASVCQMRTSAWPSFEGRRITHLRFFDESEPTNVGEYVYDSPSGQYVRADTAAGGSPPAAPANQRFEYDGAAIVLSWDASDGADSYTVYHDDFFDSGCRLSLGSTSFCEVLATDLSDTTYIHADPDSRRNYYWVVACNRTGCSEIDSRYPARLGGPPPHAPANQRYERDGAAIVVSWDASYGADSYTVYYDSFFDSNCSVGSGGPMFCEELATDLSSTSYTHSSPDRDSNYYWVVACNRFGCSFIDTERPARVVP